MTSRLPPAPEFGAALPVSTAPETLRFLALRRSASALALGEPGPTDAELADLLRLATRVPDHGKLAPWRFIVMDGADKAAFADRLEALARRRGDASQVAKLAKLRTPALAVVVVSGVKPGAIPEWEQVLSAGAVCTTLVYGALAMGYGANWITDWYSYDAEALAALGVRPDERVAGFVMLGSSGEPPLERERADPSSLVTRWKA